MLLDTKLFNKLNSYVHKPVYNFRENSNMKMSNICVQTVNS